MGPIGSSFGDVVTQPAASAKAGDVVSAVFRSANPRNDLKTDETYLTIERQNGTSWDVVATDSDWETRFIWARHSKLSAESYATIEWHVPVGAREGTYRIQHFNAA